MEDTNFKHIIKKTLAELSKQKASEILYWGWFHSRTTQSWCLRLWNRSGNHETKMNVSERGKRALFWLYFGLIRSFDKMCSSFYHDRKGHCPWDRWAVMEKEIDISLRESSVTRGEGSPEGHYLGERWRTRLFTKSRPATSPEQEIPESSVTNYLYLESK